MKVVYNACYGGFSLSEAGIKRYAEIKGVTLYPEQNRRFGFITFWTVPAGQRTAVLEGDAWNDAPQEARAASNQFYSDHTISERDFDRADPVLVRVVEELGEAANGMCAQLAIDNVPAGALWRIDEYDGNQRVMTQDSYDWKTAT